MDNAEKEAAAADPATEAKAIAAVVEAFQGLDAAAVARVLGWAAQRYGAPVTSRASSRSPGERVVPASNGDGVQENTYADLAELYSTASPTTDADKMLVAAYWQQVHEQQENFDSQTVNGALKNLGHQVRNVTRACSVLMRAKPALMIQVKKSGSTQQARKLLRLTGAGIARVRQMLSQETQP
jgi:hypothetical protein